MVIYMGKMSRDKGKRGERESCTVLERILGIKLRRSQQVKGTADSADIEPVDSEWKLHPEIKRTESTISVATYKAIKQAVADCGDNIPFVMSRKNGEDWLIIIRVDDLIPFCEEVLKVKSQHTKGWL
jgi:hypothetical protein